MALGGPDSILPIPVRRFLNRQSLFDEAHGRRTKDNGHKLKRVWLQFDVKEYFSSRGQ